MVMLIQFQSKVFFVKPKHLKAGVTGQHIVYSQIHDTSRKRIPIFQ